MNKNHRKTIGFGLLALFAGLISGGWIGFIVHGGSSNSFSDALELTTAFIVISPFLLFSILAILHDDFMHGGEMQIILRVCVGVLLITTSWLIAHRSGRVRFQIGTFIGALIYNTTAGITVVEGLSA